MRGRAAFQVSWVSDRDKAGTETEKIIIIPNGSWLRVTVKRAGAMRVGKFARILQAAIAGANRKHTMAFAAGLSYYFVMSLFPALIAISAVVGFLPVPNLSSQVLVLTAHFVPADSMGVVRYVVNDVITPHRGALLSFGVIGTLWSASTGFAGMIEALNVAYDVPETRPFWKTRGLAVLLAFLVGGLLVVAMLLMLVGPRFGEWMAGVLHLNLVLAHIWPVIRWTVSVAFIVTAVESMYFLAPNVKQRFAHTLTGALVAVGAWLFLSDALGIYFQRFANLNRTYGALGGAIALMTWLYWSWFVILLGAEINGQVLLARGAGGLELKQALPQKETAKPEAASDIAA
jgi:membrane protein